MTSNRCEFFNHLPMYQIPHKKMCINVKRYKKMQIFIEQTRFKYIINL